MRKETIGHRVMLIMKREGLTSQQLAAKVDKHVTTIDRIRHDENTPSDATLRTVANALNTTFEFLKTGDGSEVAQAKTEANAISDPYRDYALQRLEKEADTWKQKYEQVFSRLEFFMDRLPLGKRKPVRETAYAETA